MQAAIFGAGRAAAAPSGGDTAVGSPTHLGLQPVLRELKALREELALAYASMRQHQVKMEEAHLLAVAGLRDEVKKLTREFLVVNATPHTAVAQPAGAEAVRVRCFYSVLMHYFN